LPFLKLCLFIVRVGSTHFSNPFSLLDKIASYTLEELDEMLVRTQDKHDVLDSFLFGFHNKETVFSKFFHVLQLVQIV
jgi:hypothetical protein